MANGVSPVFCETRHGEMKAMKASASERNVMARGAMKMAYSRLRSEMTIIRKCNEESVMAWPQLAGLHQWQWRINNEIMSVSAVAEKYRRWRICLMAAINAII
jgi:hypothetical protein